MKIKVSIILFIFGISGIPSIMKTSASTLSMQQFDKSTMIKKKRLKQNFRCMDFSKSVKFAA